MISVALFLLCLILSGIFIFCALVGLAACMRSSEISREEEQAGATEGAWPKHTE